MLKVIKKAYLEDEGATAIEYALIASLISVAIVGALSALSPQVGGIFSSTATAMDGAANQFQNTP